MLNVWDLLARIGRSDPSEDFADGAFADDAAWVERLGAAETPRQCAERLAELESRVPPGWLAPWWRPQSFEAAPQTFAAVALRLFALDRAVLYQPLMMASRRPPVPPPRRMHLVRCLLSPTCARGYNHRGKCDAKLQGFSRVTFLDRNAKPAAALLQPAKAPAPARAAAKAPAPRREGRPAGAAPAGGAGSVSAQAAQQMMFTQQMQSAMQQQARMQMQAGMPGGNMILGQTLMLQQMLQSNVQQMRMAAAFQQEMMKQIKGLKRKMPPK